MLSNKEISEIAFEEAMSSVIHRALDENNEVMLLTRDVYRTIFGLFQAAAESGNPLPEFVSLEEGFAELSPAELLQKIDEKFEIYETLMLQARDSGDGKAIVTSSEYTSLCKAIAYMDKVSRFIASASGRQDISAAEIPAVDPAVLADLRACVFRADHGDL